MKRLLLFSLTGLALLPRAAVATDLFYINAGTASNVQVDAVNFVNKGLFQATTLFPYETLETLNFTNTVGTFSGSGTMIGDPGFRFGTTSSSGVRSMASSFFNDNGAVVQAKDSASVSYYGCVPARVGPSYLLVTATNLAVKAGISASPRASLSVGPNGTMELTGNNVDISRSGLAAQPVWDEPQIIWIVNCTNFIPDIAINDLYWGVTNFTKDWALYSAYLWDGTYACAQGDPWAQPNSDPGFCIGYPVADSYINPLPGSMMTVTITNQDCSRTDITFPTNITKGALFVAVSAGTTVQEGFTRFPNYFDRAEVLLAVQVTNLVSQRMEPAYVFVWDELATPGTCNTGLWANMVGCPPTTFQPANYLVSRSPFPPGPPGNNGYPTNNFFLASGVVTDPSVLVSDEVTNSIVDSGLYSSYGAFLDNVVTRPLPVPGGTVTNLPGRVRVASTNLDMGRTRVRAEGEIVIQTSHLISSSNAVVDCEHLSFDLASTNGNLNVQYLSKDSALRFRGTLRLWSATWSNTAFVVLKSYICDTNGVSTGQTNLTNTVSIGYHAFMMDATALGVFALPVTVHNFSSPANTTNVVISDNMTMGESFVMNGKSLTLNGNLTIPGVVPVVNPSIGVAPPGDPFRDWTAANAPNLLYFTNHGAFGIANVAHFGDDRAAPYSTFVNTGSIGAASIALDSGYFENRGSLSSAGLLFMQCASGKLDGGSSSSGGDSQFLAGTVKFNNYQLAAGGGLYLTVTNSLLDAGGGSGNSLKVQNGFIQQIKPLTGDLLGTALETSAPDVPSVWINHLWAGADRGASAAGYTNDTALGQLVLSSQSPDPFFYFAGAGAQNGLYVDLLDLSALGANYANEMAIDPSLTIYFAAAKLGVTPPQTNGVRMEAEEYLDGQFGGHLRWVQSFAGPNSSVAVINSNGVSVMVNRALRYSLIIDSDGDGIPNGLDAYPFGTPTNGVAANILVNLAVASAPPTTATVSWNAIAHKVYQVQCTTNPLSASAWQTVLNYSNAAATNGIVTTQIPVSPGVSRQFYRVKMALP